MIFTIGLVKSERKVLIKSFDLTLPTFIKTIDLSEIKNEKINLLLEDGLSQSTSDGELMAIMEDESKYYPIGNAQHYNLNEQNFSNLSFHAARDIITKCYTSWVLNNNLKNIESIFSFQEHLKDLWPNDRIDFFEELWFLLKKNLGATELKLIYNGLKPNDKGTSKNQLTQFRTEGHKLPSTHIGDDFEKGLMESYKQSLDQHFTITEYDKGQGQLVACALIKESPVIIMAELLEITSLQKAFFSGLFEGLQRI